MDERALLRFRRAIAGPPAGVDLLGAAVAIASIGGRQPLLDDVRAELDGMASAVRLLAGQEAGVEETAQAVDQHLFSELGFQGMEDGAAQPEASFVDRVLAERRGIPVSLSLVYMEVGRRAGLVCRGVGFPGHFLVLIGDVEDGFYVDPFHHGARLDREELQARLAGLRGIRGRPEGYLMPITARQVIQYMLNNLRATCRRAGRLEEWCEAVELALALEPWNSALVGERGMLRYRLGDLGGALEDLERYISAQERVSVGARRFLDELRLRMKSEGRQ